MLPHFLEYTFLLKLKSAVLPVPCTLHPCTLRLRVTTVLYLKLGNTPIAHDKNSILISPFNQKQ